MPQLPSSRKALRQSLKRRERNRLRKRAFRRAVRAAVDAARAGATEEMGTLISAAQKSLDKAAKTGAIHKRAAARRKSRLMKRINKLAQATASS